MLFNYDFRGEVKMAEDVSIAPKVTGAEWRADVSFVGKGMER